MASQVSEILQKYNDEDSFQSSVIKMLTKYPVLQTWIKRKVENDSRIINLIVQDWKSVLTNNPIFQDYLHQAINYFSYENNTKGKKTSNYKIQNYSQILNVLVIGMFKMKPKDENCLKPRLSMVACRPLECIGSIMCLKDNKTVIHNPYFFFNSCRAVCSECRKFNSSDELWCVKNCMWYDTALKYVDRERCENLFNIQTCALVHLEINMFYSFSGYSRIGGQVHSLIFFRDIFDVGNDISNIVTSDEQTKKRKAEEENGLDMKRLESEEVIGVPKSLQEKYSVQTTVTPMP